MKRLKFILVSLWCFLGSYYLTCFIDKVTLETLYQKIFVYMFFLVVLVLFSLLVKCYFKSSELMPRDRMIRTVVSIGITVIIIIAGFDGFIGLNRPIKLSITAMGQTGEIHSDQKGTEVWITSITLDKNMYSLSDVQLATNWEFRDNCLLSYQDQPSTLEIELPSAKNIEICFVSHSWSGEVLVESSAESHKIDLYRSEAQAGEKIVKITVPDEKIIFLDWEMLYIISCFIFLLGLVSTFLNLYKIKSVQRFAWLLVLFFSLVILPFELDRVTYIILIILIIFISMYLPELILNNSLKKYYTSKNTTLFTLINIYGTFALVGQHLFLDGERMIFSIMNLCKYFIFLIVVFSVNYLILFLLEKAYLYFGSKFKNKTEKKGGIKTYCFYFLLFFIPWIIALVSFFPANMTPDSIDQWKQAQGLVEISNHHPAFHTLMIRWISQLYPSPFVVGLFQVIFCALVLSDIWVYFASKKYNKYILIVLALVMAISPGNIMLVTTLWKDIPYTFSLLWLGGLLLRAFEDSFLFFKKPFLILSLIISLVFVYEFRHNGVIPFILAMTSLIILAISKITKDIFLTSKIIVCGVLSVLCVILINGPVFNHYNVNTVGVGGTKFTPMLTALGSIVHNNLPIEEEAVLLMESTTVTLDEYKEYYSRFNGDAYIYGIPNKSWNRSNLNMSEVLKVYLDVIIKDRLDGTEILWNITQAQGSFNYKYDIGVWSTDGTMVSNSNMVVKILRYYGAAFEKVLLLNVLFWRSGIYIVFLMILLLFCYIKKIYKSMVFLIPCLGNLISLLLSLYHQSYRYIYFMPISVIIYVLIVLVNTGEKEEERLE